MTFFLPGAMASRSGQSVFSQYLWLNYPKSTERRDTLYILTVGLIALLVFWSLHKLFSDGIHTLFFQESEPNFHNFPADALSIQQEVMRISIVQQD